MGAPELQAVLAVGGGAGVFSPSTRSKSASFVLDICAPMVKVRVSERMSERLPHYHFYRHHIPIHFCCYFCLSQMMKLW